MKRWINSASPLQLGIASIFIATVPGAILSTYSVPLAFILIICEIGALLGVCVFGIVSNRRRVIHLQESLQGRDERQLRQFLAALYLQSAGPPGALSLPFGGAAIDPDFAVHLVQILNSRRPRLVVELGSGVSTVLCALVLREHGSGRIVSIEHDPVYAQATRERLATFHLEQVAEVRNAPLSEVDVDGRSWRWYDRSVFLDLENIDLLVVDGPPGWLHTQARFPALPVLIDRMSSNAAILLDDAGRQDEKSIIEDWLKRWPNLSRVDLPSEKGTALLVRTSERRHTDNPAAAD